ncbi:MAG: nucleoside 2-deoxyribosyltransferase [Motiliproteus sp.]|jgi:nucleoside 2-deoxyribosyltransferase
MSQCIYLAGPLGFSEVGRLFHQQQMIPALQQRGFELLDPWQLSDTAELQAALALTDLNKQRAELRHLNTAIGRMNTEAIDRCDWIVANLDGVDVDSGTAAEIGYGYARGKCIFGYRGDFRLSCDNLGSTVNLQVEYFIQASGGEIYTRFEALLDALMAARDK